MNPQGGNMYGPGYNGPRMIQGQQGQPGGFGQQMGGPGYGQPGMGGLGYGGQPMMGGPGHGQPGMMGGNQMNMMANPNAFLAATTPKFPVKGMLTSMAGIFIKQKFELIEAQTGCETKNKYYVYENQGGKKVGKKLLKCKESSDFCARCCLPGNCRPFDMKCKNLFNNESMAFVFERPYQCSFACFNLAEMRVLYTEEGKDQYLGKVLDNCDCLNYSFSILDHTDKVIYFVEADCCQWGFFCQCPCDKCETIYFDVYRGNKEQKLDIQLVKIGKKSCIKNMIGDADNFSVPFPQGAPFEHRALLLALGLFLDYRLFEESMNNEENKNYHF